MMRKQWMILKNERYTSKDFRIILGIIYNIHLHLFVWEIMDDKLLLKVAILVSVAGLIALAFLLAVAEIPQFSVEGFVEDDDIGADDYVKVSGTVHSVQNYDSVSIITLKQSVYLETVAFDNVSLEEGSHITVEGKVQESNGRRQIIVQQIR